MAIILGFLLTFSTATVAFLELIFQFENRRSYNRNITEIHG